MLCVVTAGARMRWDVSFRQKERDCNLKNIGPWSNWFVRDIWCETQRLLCEKSLSSLECVSGETCVCCHINFRSNLAILFKRFLIKDIDCGIALCLKYFINHRSMFFRYHLFLMVLPLWNVGLYWFKGLPLMQSQGRGMVCFNGWSLHMIRALLLLLFYRIGTQ